MCDVESCIDLTSRHRTDIVRLEVGTAHLIWSALTRQRFGLRRPVAAVRHTALSIARAT